MKDKLKKILLIFNEKKLLILKSLYECHDYLCGCDLVTILDVPKNLLSHHLKVLIDLGYVSETRCGRKKNYRLVGGKEEKVKKILELTELI